MPEMFVEEAASMGMTRQQAVRLWLTTNEPMTLMSDDGSWRVCEPKTGWRPATPEEVERAEREMADCEAEEAEREALGDPEDLSGVNAWIAIQAGAH